MLLSEPVERIWSQIEDREGRAHDAGHDLPPDDAPGSAAGDPDIDESCPFCSAEPALGATPHAKAFRDAYPVSDGHALIVPVRHVASIFDLSSEEQRDLWELVAEVRARLAAKTDAAGFTVGANDGAAAGQTIGHAHVHVIPRRAGDVPDPRGGIRWVIPERAPYWERP